MLKSSRSSIAGAWLDVKNNGDAMPAINFKKEFVSLIRNGSKRTTIRKFRKDGKKIKEGDILYLFTGQRTRNCTRIGTFLCILAYDVLVTCDNILVQEDLRADKHYDLFDRELLARFEGFYSFDEFLDGFSTIHCIPFNGRLIMFEPVEKRYCKEMFR